MCHFAEDDALERCLSFACGYHKHCSIPPVLDVTLDTNREEDLAADPDLQSTVLEDRRDLQVVLGVAYGGYTVSWKTCQAYGETYSRRSKSRS